jgi:Fuc2NAc and GlcNAc transferase
MVRAAGVLLAFAATLLLTAWVRAFALSHGRVDVPNARSSHTRPTARGGGAAIAAVLITCVLVLGFIGALNPVVAIGCGIGGALVALVGYLDDVLGLAVTPRLSVHLLAALLIAGVVVFARDADAGAFFPALPRVAVLLLLVLATTWSINLFNFMDGIDGIAASEAAFVSAASALLASLGPAQSGWTMLALLTFGASLGFLPWNWPSARIFMGDVGSGFLGFWLAALAIGFHSSGTLPIWSSATLAAVFIADATTTLIRRALRGEQWYEAHRSHGYQILARRLRSHFKVTSLVWLVNVVFLLPLAYLSVLCEQLAPWIALAAVAMLSASCWLIGAGTAESRPPSKSAGV